MTDKPITVTAAGETLAEAVLGRAISKKLPASMKPIWFMRAIKLPKCPACGAPNLSEANKVCTGCGGPSAEPRDERYQEVDMIPRVPPPTRSLLARILRMGKD